MANENTQEPSITINGSALTTAQAMTVRVGLASFQMMLADEGLGDDEHGNAMTSGYLARLAEINKLMFHAKG
jgi:hypothetical protein